MVAVFGTTISPYLFFWQAAEEVEDIHAHPRRERLRKAPQQGQAALHRIEVDTLVGMAFSNLVALAIMITAAATLNANGTTDIQSSAQAAEALRPIAGNFAFVVFALGIVGTGLLAVPVLAGSAAYALGEARKWPVGFSRRWQEATPDWYVTGLLDPLHLSKLIREFLQGICARIDQEWHTPLLKLLSEHNAWTIREHGVEDREVSRVRLEIGERVSAG